MEYRNFSEYKSYLPSKKIQLVILALIMIGIAYVAVPPLVQWIKKLKTEKQLEKPVLVTLPVGDPTMRDTDSDGVPDWQEILVGLDPYNKTTKGGVSDYTTFETLKNKIGNDLFIAESNRVTDTDKLALTLYDTLSQNTSNIDGITAGTAQVVTEQELYNYISSQKATVKEITIDSLNIVESSLENNKLYIEQMKKIINNESSISNIPQKIKSYLDNPTPADISAVQTFLKEVNKETESLIAISVPRPIAINHLIIINSLKGALQILEAYDPSTIDELIKTSTGLIIQDYFTTLAKSLGTFSIYGSIALDKNGYE